MVLENPIKWCLSGQKWAIFYFFQTPQNHGFWNFDFRFLTREKKATVN